MGPAYFVFACVCVCKCVCVCLFVERARVWARWWCESRLLFVLKQTHPPRIRVNTLFYDGAIVTDCLY